MPDLLLAPYTDSLGHAGRSLQIAKLAASLGAEVVVAGGGEFDRFFPYEVFQSPQIPYPSLGQWLKTYLPGLPFIQLDRNGNLEGMVEPALKLDNLTDQWIRILKKRNPAVVVADGRPEVYWAAKALGIRLYGIISYVWTDHYCRTYGYAQINASCRENDPVLLKAFNRVGESLGLFPIRNCWEPFRGDTGLVPDSRLFTGDEPIDGHRVLGALIWDGQVPEALDGTKTVIPETQFVYITCGTSRFPIFEELAVSISKRGIPVVYSGAVRSVALSKIVPSKNLKVCRGIANGTQISERAQLVLCHGGSQTLYQAAAAGTLSYVVPQHFDHRRNAKMFSSHSFAVEVSCEVRTEDIVERIVDAYARENKPPVSLPAEVDGTILMEVLTGKMHG